MIVAAHQPHYLPWLGYLGKIADCDLFVVMDDLQYEQQNFQNRNRVKLASGPSWLSVPLERGGRDERICDKRIATGESARQHWQRRHFETLRSAYSAAPFWRSYEPELRDVYTRPWETLLALDLHLLRLHLDWFGIATPVQLSSTLTLQGAKSDRLEALCRAVGADVYLSGSGGSRGYLDVAQLERAGVRVTWQRFSHPIYPQRHDGCGFVSHLAALDLLLNCGPQRSRELLHAALVPPTTTPLAA